MKPGISTCFSNCRSIVCGWASSQGRSVSSVPTSTIMPSRTATAVASGSDGSMVRILRAVKTVILDIGRFLFGE